MDTVIEGEVAILMATYNGDKYIENQIQSIINQSYTNWKLFIRDDGSSDKTKIIIDKFTRVDHRIHELVDNLGNLGPRQNFEELIKNNLKYKYIMFADQDDVWLPNKVIDSVRTIKKIEGDNRDLPILIYSNYYISDKNLNKKKIVYEKLNQNYIAERLLVHSWVMGCTSIINSSLASLATNIPMEAENHDNWLAILASVLGIIYYMDEPSMIHRIHEDNVTKNINTNLLSNRYKRIRGMIFNGILEKNKLTQILIKRITEKKISVPQVLKKYQYLLELGGIRAIVYAKQNHFYAFTEKRTILFYLQLLVSKKRRG